MNEKITAKTTFELVSLTAYGALPKSMIQRHVWENVKDLLYTFATY